MNATVNIIACAACGKNHDKLDVFKRESFFLEFYAKCPETGAHVFVLSSPPSPEEVMTTAQEWGFKFGV